MSIGETISAAREAQGMTQSDLAGKVFVTRQAVSRWETGATTPGVDMCKLLAAALNMPVTRLLEMPPEPCCQSCSLPLGKETDYGAEADGTKSEEYCTWCYPDGSFTGEESLDAFIEHSAPYMAKAAGISEDEAVSYLAVVLPTLGRWADPDGRARQGARYPRPRSRGAPTRTDSTIAAGTAKRCRSVADLRRDLDS